MNENETETVIDRTEADAPELPRRSKPEYAPFAYKDEPTEEALDARYRMDAIWLRKYWPVMTDDETLEVTVGGLKRFLSDRLHEALSAQLDASDGEDDK